MIPIAENAIADYIRGHRDSSADEAQDPSAVDFTCQRAGALCDVPIHEGRNTQQRGASAVVVTARDGNKPWDDENWHAVTVDVQLFTHRHHDEEDTAKAEVVHNERRSALFDLFCLDGSAKAYLNKPESPAADTRAVKPFHLHGLFVESQGFQAIENGMVDTVTLSLMCAPINVTR